MMICKADFEELFPETFASDAEDAAPLDANLARWEDDGGSPRPAAPAPRTGQTAWPMPAAYGFADPARFGLAVATLPMISTGNAARAMFSAFGFPHARN